jgi:DNA repair protein RecN (Recombination protein N)
MLVGLSIRDIVLIERLDLDLYKGLGVLTGETGAGKSILLDSLGLCLGARADSGLVRHGADKGQVSAQFFLDADHPARRLLADQDLDDADDNLVLRRVIGKDGRSRAFVNDQPISAGLMRELGELLVEIQGQHDRHGLMDATTHRELLDAMAGNAARLKIVQGSWDAMRKAASALAEAEEVLANARGDEDYLRHVLAELDEIEPVEDEEAGLAEQRALLMNAERLADAVSEAESALGGSEGATARLREAERALEKVSEQAAGHLDGALKALERAAIEAAEAAASVEEAGRAFIASPAKLNEIEDRLYKLRELARKHRVTVDQLADLRTSFAERLAAIDGGDTHLEGLRAAAKKTRDIYLKATSDLSAVRQKSAKKLDKAVAKELPPLKLEKATFLTVVESLDESAWTRDGADRVAFEVATNPGQPAGPLTRVASGGELSRFLLSLKVVLASTRIAPTLVFDEVDSGIGGATADAVGERLARLSDDTQVLVITHSPQVAARGDHHWRVAKGAKGKETVTEVTELTADERREELARMLAGATVTDQARAAADSLIDAHLQGQAGG